MKKLLSASLAIIMLLLCLVPLCSFAENELPVYVPGSRFSFPTVKKAPGTENPIYRDCYWCDWIYYILGEEESKVNAVVQDKGWTYDRDAMYDWMYNDYRVNVFIGTKIISYPDEALALTFVKKFGIPREAFEALIEMIKNSATNEYLDEGSMYHELPNADIIYTLDNDIIKNYYKYVNVDPWPSSGERKYRYCYYAWTLESIMILYYYDRNLLNERYNTKLDEHSEYTWMDEMYENSRLKEMPDEMPLVTFIKKFDIPRDLMEYIVNIQFKELHKDYLAENADNEFGELPNLDVIYTFDNKKINAYYALETPTPGTGESDMTLCTILAAASLAVMAIVIRKRRIG